MCLALMIFPPCPALVPLDLFYTIELLILISFQRSTASIRKNNASATRVPTSYHLLRDTLSYITISPATLGTTHK
jgi:hypothetical protein